MNYIMVTPCHNEEQNLPALIGSVLNQKIKPKLWLIVNDASTDNSLDLLKKASKKHRWIIHTTLTNSSSKRDLSFRYSNVCKIGFDAVQAMAQKSKIKYGYLALLDSDFELSDTYFSDLISFMDKNPEYGIVSGGLYYRKKGKLAWEKHPLYLPIGGARLLRKKCLDDIGDLPVSYSPDTVCEIKAITRGWKLKQLKNVHAVQQRLTCSAEGLWKGYQMLGASNYYLGYTPFLISLKALKMTFKKPHYAALPFIIGYAKKYVMAAPKIEDQEVRLYCKNKKLWERFTNEVST